ncbi:hypothetical protein EON66_04865, partial [archaeon]
AVHSSDAATQLDGVRLIRRLLSANGSVPAKEVVETGVLPRLVELLAHGNTDMQVEAAWTLTNVTSTDYTHAVVDCGACPVLAAGCAVSDPRVRDHCIWCLGNIAGDSVALRDMLLATPGVLHNLLLNVQHPETPVLLRNAAWALSNFGRGSPLPPQEYAMQVLQALAYLLTSDDQAVLADALWGISYMVDNEESVMDVLVSSGILKRCIELLAHAEVTVLTPALRIVGNAVSGTDAQTEAAMSAGFLSATLPLLRSIKRNVRREACWSLSNVAAGTKDQITALLFNADVMNEVITLASGGEWNVRKEAAWVLCNIVSAGNEEHVFKFMAMGAEEPFIELLGRNDARTANVVLESIATILRTQKRLQEAGHPYAASCHFRERFEELGLIYSLECVSDSPDSTIADKAYQMLVEFFPYNEEGADAADVDDENGVSAPGLAANAYGSKHFVFDSSVSSPLPAAAHSSLSASHLSAAPGTPGGFNFSSIAFA